MLICKSVVVFFFKQKTAYERRISDWSSDVCSSDLIVVGIALFDEARVVGESGDVVLGEITQHRVHALLQLVQAGAEMEACGLACAFEDLVTMLQGNVNVALNELRQMDVAHLGGVDPAKRSEEHTSELQSLLRISYAVF